MSEQFTYDLTSNLILASFCQNNHGIKKIDRVYIIQTAIQNTNLQKRLQVIACVVLEG